MRDGYHHLSKKNLAHILLSHADTNQRKSGNGTVMKQEKNSHLKKASFFSIKTYGRTITMEHEDVLKVQRVPFSVLTWVCLSTE